MFKKAATGAVLALGLSLSWLGVLAFMSPGCESDCACQGSGVGRVSLQCWCGTTDCAPDAATAAARLCKSPPPGTHIRREVGCGQIRIGGWNDRTPTGEHLYFDEATGKHTGGFVLGDRPFGPCEKTSYGYGVYLECALTTSTTLCEGSGPAGRARTDGGSRFRSPSSWSFSRTDPTLTTKRKVGFLSGSRLARTK